MQRGWYAALLLIIVAPAAADDVNLLIGTWVGEDGATKAEYSREFDGSWVTTRMWFKFEDEWKLVATGAMYQRPGEGSTWRMVGRSTDMGGIVLFETTFEFLGDGQVRLVSTVFNDDGTTRIAEEDWAVTDEQIVYDIYDIKDGERVPLFSSRWLRAAGDQP